MVVKRAGSCGGVRGRAEVPTGRGSVVERAWLVRGRARVRTGRRTISESTWPYGGIRGHAGGPADHGAVVERSGSCGCVQERAEVLTGHGAVFGRAWLVRGRAGFPVGQGAVVKRAWLDDGSRGHAGGLADRGAVVDRTRSCGSLRGRVDEPTDREEVVVDPGEVSVPPIPLVDDGADPGERHVPFREEQGNLLGRYAWRRRRMQVVVSIFEGYSENFKLYRRT